MKKFLIALPLALSLGFIALPANAGPSPGIAVGEPNPNSSDYPHRHHPRPDYDEQDDDYGDYDQISCWEGKRLLRYRGFQQIQPLRCEGSTYRYRAMRGSRTFLIRVDSYAARIVSVRQIRYY